MASREDVLKDVSPYRLYHWRSGERAATELVSAATGGMPEGLVVSDQAEPRFSRDGRRLFLGTAPPPEAPPVEGAPQPRAVDIWHYLDPWFTYRLSDGVKVNLTGKVDSIFWREDHDSSGVPGAYGSAGWTTSNASVLLYDKYDIWEIRPDGTGARMVTGGHGRGNEIVFRYRSLDPEERAIPTDKPLLLSANDDETEGGGFYRVAYSGSSAPVKIVMVDKSFGPVIKARNADRVVFTQSRFDEFPDLWTSDTSFRDMKKLSNANPQQAEYLWGRAELTHYFNADGRSLRALLIKPENFDRSQKYPLMVYIYEGLSEGLHTYRAPGPGTSVNITRYVSNGYVALLPDIVYDTGYPGESAEKCEIPAVNTILAEGYIDPKRVGIQGHSWGGYQITHLITRTNMFAAVQAVSVSNMISAYGGIRWGSGMSRAFQYEKTQSRIGAPPWDAPLQFIENSPILWVPKVQTPYLTIHNDEDDAVPWYQAIEFFSALRRLGKEAISSTTMARRTACAIATTRSTGPSTRTSSSITSCWAG